MSNSKSVIFVENKKQMTLYEALDAFKDIRDTAISTESKRKIESISQDWQSVNTNMTLYYNTISSGDTTAADVYIDEIIEILSGYDLTVDLPVQFPLSLSVFSSPSTIQVPVDVDGLNPDYTNALSVISVYIGGVDDSANWVYAVTSSSNATAAIQNTNEVKVSALTANSGSITIEISKTGYTTITFYISVNRGYGGVGTGGTIQNVNGSIQPVSEYPGTVTGNDRAAYSIDFQTRRTAATQITSAERSGILSGWRNSVINGYDSVICGGTENSIDSPYMVFIGAGSGNTITQSGSGYGVIVGGSGNTVTGSGALIVGGSSNTASGLNSGVLTGSNNTATGSYSSALSGLENTAGTYAEVVIGHYANTITGTAGSISSTDPVFRIGNGTGTGARSDAFKVLKDGGVFAHGLKSGVDQATAGAAADEIWIDTADNSLKIGV